MKSASDRTNLGQGIPHRARSTFSALPAELLHRIANALAEWLEARRQLRDLAELDPHLLRDIGLTEADRRGMIAARPRQAKPPSPKEHCND